MILLIQPANALEYMQANYPGFHGADIKEIIVLTGKICAQTWMLNGNNRSSKHLWLAFLSLEEKHSHIMMFLLSCFTMVIKCSWSSNVWPLWWFWVAPDWSSRPVHIWLSRKAEKDTFCNFYRMRLSNLLYCFFDWKYLLQNSIFILQNMFLWFHFYTVNWTTFLLSETLFLTQKSSVFYFVTVKCWFFFFIISKQIKRQHSQQNCVASLIDGEKKYDSQIASTWWFWATVHKV